AAQVLDVVDVDDVVDDAGDALRQVGCPPDPRDAVVVHEDGRVAEDLVAGPQAADVGQQPNGHRITAPHAGSTQRTACAAPTESAPGPDDMGGLLLSSANAVR